MSRSGVILLGQYRPIDSYLHRLDTRAKMIPVFLILILALFTDSYFFYLGILALLVMALIYSGVSRETILLSFKPMLWLVGVTVLYHLIFSGQGTKILLDIFGYKLTLGAVNEAAFYSLRLILFVSMAFLVTLTSSPSDIGDAFAKTVRPLRRFKVPVEDISLILFMAIRFIPVLYEEFVIIKNAQKLRGVDFSGSITNRLQKSAAIIVPVFVAAIGRADELAQAIEVRGYGKAVERTFYSHSNFGVNEIGFASICLIVIGALFYFSL
ncbi:MAG: energy-coupling factor transporter transmembrane component T family protein [Candidatus Zixiibacteriota bacterium]